jgi:NADPH:quinone reductase-like Zn-dependent oxidoreductase
MNAVVVTKYGSPDVLRLEEMTKPVPAQDEVLVKVYASSLNSRDWRLMRANPFFVRFMPGGLLRPRYKIPGVDVAGRIEAVGSKVTQWREGDEVFGMLADGRGALAEYVCAGETDLAPKPANLSFEQAAALPLAAMTALQALRDSGHVQSGQKVLIYGASGGVGSFAVQIAKALGAEVTAVCSTRNVDMVRSIGADRVIDYRKDDFTRHGERYDLIVAVNGYRPISDYLKALKPEGVYVVAGGSMAQLFEAAVRGRRKSGQPRVEVVWLLRRNQEDLILLKELAESSRVSPVIDAVYPLEQASEALRYFEDVHPRGKVVITVGGAAIAAK